MSLGARSVRTALQRTAAATALAWLALGCSSQSTNPGGDGGSGGADGGGGTGGVVTQACQNGGTCVTPASEKDGWKGPVAVYRGTQPTACGSPYGNTAYEGHAELVAGDATCECTCTAENVQCEAKLALTYSMSNDCADECTGSNLTIKDGECGTFSNPDSTTCPVTGVKSASTTGTATCKASQPTVTKPTPTWTDSVIACSPSAELPAGECNGKLCAPELPAPLDQLCIFGDGDRACPAGMYQKKWLAYEGFVDGRTCQCSCDTASVACGGVLTSWSGSSPFANCATTPGTDFSLPVATCTDLTNGDAHGAIRYAADPQSNCPPLAKPFGEVTPDLATTFCCL